MNTQELQSEKVGRFYDQHADAFSKSYGDILQAFRTANVNELLAHEAAAMGITHGMRLLDAGCGVCGPAIYFAQHFGLFIDAITSSAVQAGIAAEKIDAAGCTDKIRIIQGDYHLLEHYYPAGSYDIIYYLESFGHSKDPATAIASAWNILKPGGHLYIKDLFIKEAALPIHEAPIRENVQRINEGYCYAVCDLYDVLRKLRQKGFIISFLKTFDIPLEIFESLRFVNDFQELTGLNPIEDLLTYIFPIDFFEILCIKPDHNQPLDKSNYLLQNMYNFQIRGLSQ